MEEHPGSFLRRATISARFMKSSLRTTAWLACTSSLPRSSTLTACEYAALAGPTISGHLSRMACSLVGIPIPCFVRIASIRSTSGSEGFLRPLVGSSEGILLNEATRSSAILLNLCGSADIRLNPGMPPIGA